MKLPEAMIEKAAKALFDRLEGSRPLDSNSELRRNTSRDIARVALEAALADCLVTTWGEPCIMDDGADIHLWVNDDGLRGKRVALVPIDD